MENFEEGMYKIMDKVAVIGKFGQYFVSEVVNQNDSARKVLKHKEIPEYLRQSSPKYTSHY